MKEDTMTTPTQRLSAAFADSTPEPRTRRLESLARLYTPDAGRDALLELKATDQAAYYRLPKAIRLNLAFYASSKAAYEEMNP